MHSHLIASLFHAIVLPSSSSVKIISSHQQLQTKISRDVHICNTRALVMLLVVVKIFDNFLKDNSTQVFEVTYSALSFAEVICQALVRVSQEADWVRTNFAHQACVEWCQIHRLPNDARGTRSRLLRRESRRVRAPCLCRPLWRCNTL